ncbi:MAG: ribokinase [Candidatus Pacebacteria bacterium]|nr:ribokinase [Candidatus Paceibacterota bacterium]
MSRVIVAGSINMDIVVTTKRHPDAGETVFGTDLKYFPGGKGANQAVAAAKLGATTVLLGKVGNDAFGEKLTNFLKEQNINTQVSKEETSTGIALITIAEETADNTIVVVPGANFELKRKDIENVTIKEGDVLVSQFEIPTETIIAFFKEGREVGTINVFNPAPAKVIPDDLFNLIDVLILNETELSFLSGMTIDTDKEESLLEAVAKIENNKIKIVVTLGEKGVVAFENGEIITIEGRKVKAVDTTGAGDCFVGAVAAALAQDKSFSESLKFANIAASLSVTKAGAGPSMPSLEEVTALM